MDGPVRQFTDDQGVEWVASVATEEGGDYKGRFYLIMHRAEGQGDPVSLVDVRWNSRKTADRTLATMSKVEMRRRLSSAVGRSGVRSPV